MSIRISLFKELNGYDPPIFIDLVFYLGMLEHHESVEGKVVDGQKLAKYII